MLKTYACDDNTCKSKQSAEIKLEQQVETSKWKKERYERRERERECQTRDLVYRFQRDPIPALTA